MRSRTDSFIVTRSVLERTVKAVFLDYGTMGPGLNLDSLRDAVNELAVYDRTRSADVVARVRDAELIFTNKNRLTPEILEQLPKLRFIGLTATGSDNIDLETARSYDIAVANIRDYCTHSVVEHVFGVLLTLTHNLNRYQASVRVGEWQTANEPFLLSHPIRDFSKMRMGIVGYGALGKGVASMARSFGMTVLISARPGSSEIPAERVSFDDIISDADVISLHCPLNEETLDLFSDDVFRRMKKTAVLINTARGGLINSTALAAALKNGDIAAAAVDVLPTEPPVDGDPLLDYVGDNLIVTPHIAWASDEARQNAIDELAANARAFIAGKERNRIA